MAFVKKEKLNKFRVGNIEIVIGDKYVLDNKFDASAPEALQKIETTKFPFEGSGITDCVNFDNVKGIYDTGFYNTSYCLNKYKEEKEELVNIYVKQIKEPYEKMTNKSLAQDSNNDFWQNYRYEAYANKEFDTNDPMQLMDLFQVIIQGVACDKNEKDPFYRQGAQFIISNPNLVKNKNKERSRTRLKAIQMLTTLADADKDKLDLVLEFNGRDNTGKVAAEDVKLIYFEVFNNPKTGLALAEKFIETCENYETEKGKETMEFFYAINKLYKFRKIIKDKRGYVTLDGVYLATTLQDIAKFCLNRDSAQYKAIEALIEENPNVRREV